MTSEALKPVAWLRTRKSNGEVDLSFEGPYKHANLFDWQPLIPAPSTELVREIAEKHYTMLGEGVHETIVDAIESAINEALGHEGVKG